MGFNTALMVYNDQIDLLSRDPNVGQKIHDAVQRSSTEPQFPFSFGYGMGVSSEHADSTQVILVGGNDIRKLSTLYYTSMYNDVEVLKALADNLGYRLVKKPEKT